MAKLAVEEIFRCGKINIKRCGLLLQAEGCEKKGEGGG